MYIDLERSDGTVRDATATGFFVKTPSGSVVLVTNRHVVDTTYHTTDRYYGWTVTRVRLLVHAFPNGVAELPVGSWMGEADPGGFVFPDDETVDVAALSPRRLAFSDQGVVISCCVDFAMLADDSTFHNLIDAGEPVAFPGYPEWYDRNGMRPILRTGTIVSDPRLDYRMQDGPPVKGDGRRQIAFEAFSLSGNSGSPVFVPQRGIAPGGVINSPGKYHPPALVGINAGHMPNRGEHSGLSYMYKATAIRDLLLLHQF